MNFATSERQLLERLRAVVDRLAGRYRELNGARNLGEYLAFERPREDEELLTEPLLAELMERLLGFPPDAYFPQLGRSGLKPDFTPHDLVAHRFVLDAKSSTQELRPHEAQIRRYIDQHQLDYGVLFNLREVRVYRRGDIGHAPELSFSVLPLWQLARGEALRDDAAVAGLIEFGERFAYRELGLGEKVDRIRSARSWLEREQRGEVVRIDLDFLVERLRDLSRLLQEDAAGRFDVLERTLAMNPGRERALLGELELIVLDLAPGTDLAELPARVDGYRQDRDLAGRAWRQYLLRVSQLALTRILLYRSWEDVEFVDSYLYDGGFDQWYVRLDEDLQPILREAFAHGRERYHWLYGPDNNYDWYRPGDEALVEVLYALVPVPLGKLDADVLGGLYESYVDDIDRDRLGQFYTPRAVVRFMVEVIDPRLGETVLDPATGTGGFLVEAYKHLEAQCRTVEDRRTLQTASIYGGEPKPLPYLLAQMNLLLHGLEYPRIGYGNSLATRITEIGDRDRVDVILTNPPFGGEEERGILANFPEDKQTAETALLFLQLIMRRLKRPPKPGRAGVVAPNGTLFAGGVAARIKEELVKEFNLHTIVRLPSGVFAPYTSIPTNLLFFDRSAPTKEVWYYEQPLPEGRRQYTKTQMIQYEAFADCLAWWRNREENERAWCVPAEQIVANGYNLDLKNPHGKVDFEHLPPEQLVEDILAKERRIFEVLGEIKQALVGVNS